MIDFKTHIKIFKSIKSEDDIDAYISGLELVERLEITRAIKDTYPIKESSDIPKELYEKFSITSKVLDAVLGQFIMIEQIITGKTTFSDDEQRDLEFAKLILRPKNHTEFDNSDTALELENEKNILSTPVQDVYNAINSYLKDRDYVLFKQFSGVFYEINDEEEDEEEEEQQEKTRESLFQNQWYWYSIVRMLAQEDIRRYDQIYMLKMSTVLPEMSYITQKEKIEKAEMRRQQALNKL